MNPSTSAETDQARLEREASFHDTRFAEDTRAEADKFYAVARASFDYYRERTLAGVKGLDVLEYGCGIGAAAFDIAELGGRACGIDISPKAIEMAEQRAAERGVSAGTRFEVMNAEALGFPDASFDRVCGSGILHHLDLERSYAEIRRVLRPGGYAVFLEPLGHNPVINWYRRRTPHLRTEDEHPLLRADLDAARKVFPRVDERFFDLTTLAAVPLRRTALFGAAAKMTALVDRVLLSRHSPLRHQAWVVVLEVGV
jgi:ubiquinone/menaquinone biosynthesis C-methylase UbiE